MSAQAEQITEHDEAGLRDLLDATIREQLDATSRAVAAADSDPVLRANAGVRWERRGLLQRLVRRRRG
jgi:hypothetical protein